MNTLTVTGHGHGFDRVLNLVGMRFLLDGFGYLKGRMRLREKFQVEDIFRLNDDGMLLIVIDGNAIVKGVRQC